MASLHDHFHTHVQGHELQGDVKDRGADRTTVTEKISNPRAGLHKLDKKIRPKAEEHLHFPARGSGAARVPSDVEDAGDGPAGPGDGGGDGQAEAGDEEGAEHGRVVLREVCVGSLGYKIGTKPC